MPLVCADELRGIPEKEYSPSDSHLIHPKPVDHEAFPQRRKLLENNAEVESALKGNRLGTANLMGLEQFADDLPGDRLLAEECETACFDLSKAVIRVDEKGIHVPSSLPDLLLDEAYVIRQIIVLEMQSFKLCFERYDFQQTILSPS